MSSSPFLLVPWGNNFLDGIIEVLSKESNTNGDLSDVLCIFPHSRPQRYLTAMLRKDARLQKPLLLPTSCTVSDLFSRLNERISSSRTLASQLDLIGLLLSIIRSEPSLWNWEKKAESPFNERGHLTKETETHHFFPWGVRLVNLFEECFSHNVQPQNIAYTEGQVTPFATSILEQLGKIFSLYIKALDEKKWTTPGYNNFTTLYYLQQNESLPSHFFENKRLIIAGFFALTGTENLLFHHLWKTYNTKILLHGDPLLCEDFLPIHGKKPHWSCQQLATWAKAWKAPIELVQTPNTDTETTIFDKNIRYVEAYDLHTQLNALQKEFSPNRLAQEKNLDNSNSIKNKYLSMEQPPLESVPAQQNIPDNPDEKIAINEFLGKTTDNEQDQVFTEYVADTAIILPQSSLLMPLLHHLPFADNNISMGYPLNHSPLFRLLDTIFTLQETKRTGGYYWKDLIELVRHPYLKMLAPKDLPEEKQNMEATLRRELHRFEQALRENNQTFAKPEEVLQILYSIMPEEDLPTKPIMELLLRIFITTLRGFANITSTRDLAKSMHSLCQLLLECGMPLWKRFPIDAECLYRFIQSVIPELESAEIAKEQLSSETIFLIARQLLQTQRVPFKADPLVGTQAMGMLETRLLNFRRVVILDATDDNIPGTTANDPLLPESLRPILGLPSLKHREDIAAYHFFRLLAGSSESIIYWQEKTGGSGLQPTKQRRSRFVEELLWAAEKKRGKVFSHSGIDGALTSISASIAPIKRSQSPVPVTPAIRKSINELLMQPISASLLDSYLRCPVRFFYERVLKLKVVDEINTENDPLKIGILLHKVLQEFYEPLLYKELPSGEFFVAEAFPKIKSILHAQVEYLELARMSPAHSFAMFTQAAYIHLERYLFEQPKTKIIALEKKILRSCEIFGKKIELTGTADRVDIREEAIRLLDYKTGKVDTKPVTIWKKDVLWEKINAFTPEYCGNKKLDPFFELSEKLGSIQLPFYLYLLYDRNKNATLGEYDTAKLNAGWVALASDGKEYSLFNNDTKEGLREEVITSQIPLLVNFVISHLAVTQTLYPRIGNHCERCPVSNACCKGV